MFYHHSRLPLSGLDANYFHYFEISPRKDTLHLLPFSTLRIWRPDNAGFVLGWPALPWMFCYSAGVGVPDPEKPFLPNLGWAHSTSTTPPWDHSVFILFSLTSRLWASLELIYVCFRMWVMDNEIQMNLFCDKLASLKKVWIYSLENDE